MLGTGTRVYDTSVTVTATTKAGYTFIGWYDDETLICSDLSYTFNMPAQDVSYTAKWCDVSTASNNTKAGTVTALSKTYIAGEQVTVTATTQAGYTFIGWFDGETLIDSNLTCTLTMPMQDTTYTAKWCKVTLTRNNTSAGTVTELTDTYVTGETVTVKATTYIGYDFTGWYNGDTLLTNELALTFAMQLQNETYTAKWIVREEYVPFNFTSTETACTINSIKDKTVSEITIPDSVTSIGSYAFYNCTNLTSVIIPDSVKTIDKIAFSDCRSLTIYCEAQGKPGGWSSDWNWSYYPVVWNCNNNNQDANGYEYAMVDGIRYSLKDNVATVIIQPTNINVANILSNVVYNGEAYPVTSIGSSAFYNCTNLTSVIIPDSVTTIDERAFRGCRSLTSITIGNSVTTIGLSAFYDCSRLTSVTIPDSVKTIGACAFDNCSSLTNVIIPDSVTSIGGSAFSGCSRLTSITLPFVGSNATATTASEDTLFGYIFGTNFSTDATIAIQDYGIGSSKTYYVPSLLKSVTITGGNILYGAFSDCESLTSITIGDSITAIGERAFEGCRSLTSITIGNSVTSIGNYAFYNCSNLTSVTIPDSVTSIGEDAFSSCSSLTSIAIPNGIRIRYNTFANCTSLKYVVIEYNDYGDYGYNSIEFDAFKGCTKLEMVYFNGTQEQFDTLEVSSSGNGSFTDAMVYYYSETEPTDNGYYWHYDTDGVTPIIWKKEN